MITNPQSGTNLHEIAPGIYRINTPVQIPGGPGFNFNQYLVADDEPLLFHTGPRRMFPLVAEAIGKVLPVEKLRYVAFSHVEADECGGLNELLAAAPHAVAVASQLAVMVSLNDLADRAPRALADGEVLRTGRRAFKWLDAPHVPHGWENGFMMELETKTMLCGDLFTQGGAGEVALTESDILGPSEAFRAPMDYFAHSPQTAATLEKLARENPLTLACMHGSAWRGDGASLIRALSRTLVGYEADPVAYAKAA
ncbi:MAG TPA: MBL fold metallo-hydrolase [Burkholderiales bacterium]|nr:MBL fold metallo-hydrolase [Burkholderiales bacterium]